MKVFQFRKLSIISLLVASGYAITIFVAGTAFVLTHVVPVLQIVDVCAVFLLLPLLGLAGFRKTRSVAGHGFLAMAYLFGTSNWMYAFVLLCASPISPLCYILAGIWIILSLPLRSLNPVYGDGSFLGFLAAFPVCAIVNALMHDAPFAVFFVGFGLVTTTYLISSALLPVGYLISSTPLPAGKSSTENRPNPSQSKMASSNILKEPTRHTGQEPKPEKAWGTPASELEANNAAERENTISSWDKFIAAYPTSVWLMAAKLRRARLVAFEAAMRSTEPAVLEFYLRHYPVGDPARQVRKRLEALESRL